MKELVGNGTSAGHPARDPAHLKILVISFRFPPYQSVGAVSVSKTVKYLVAFGHEVRVVAARNQHVPATLPLETDPRSVVATGWLDPMRFAARFWPGGDRIAMTGFSGGSANRRLAHQIGRVYRRLMAPDTEIGWGWPAYRVGSRLAASWMPDVIYASAPPYTGLLAARAVASRSGTPWVAGLRDLWADFPHRTMRLSRVDRALEARILSSAAGVVVTTDEAAEIVRARYGLPTVTVMNGYDPDDARDHTIRPEQERLRIVYTGVLMHERRDPGPLFHAMRDLRHSGRIVTADFFGRDSRIVSEAANCAGVGDLVAGHGPIPHRESIQTQRDADVLLLLQTDEPAERHTCPAKLFEYAAARRPVLFIGPEEGAVGRLIREYRLGTVVQRADDVVRELGRLIDLKARTGYIPDISSRPPMELSRPRQIERLASFLNEVARSREGTGRM